MATALPTFDGTVKWFRDGCLVCQSNISRPGEAVGIQAVSLDVEDDIDGTFVLCYTHAVEVGRAVNMVTQEAVNEKAAEVGALLEEANEALAEARSASAQARLDKDTVERLLGSVYIEPAEVPGLPEPFGPGVGA